jgi:mRNA interferase YafQ
VRTFSRSNEFKRDVRLAQRRGKNLCKLQKVMNDLISNTPLPYSLHDHPLHGDFKGSRDCHIEPDWILIYTLSDNNTHVHFVRTGSHSDLFR